MSEKTTPTPTETTGAKPFLGHPFSPGRSSQACQVMLARYRCPYPAEAHPAATEESA